MLHIEWSGIRLRYGLKLGSNNCAELVTRIYIGALRAIAEPMMAVAIVTVDCARHREPYVTNGDGK